MSAAHQGLDWVYLVRGVDSKPSRESASMPPEAIPTDPTGWFPPQPPEPPKSTLAIVGGAIKSAVLYCYNWEKANPRKTAAILLYISTHSTHLKPVLDMLSIITGMPLS